MESSAAVISHIFHHFPLVTLPYFSWTCRTLREQAIEFAKQYTINPDTVDVFVGRWMFRHGCKVDPPFIRDGDRVKNIENGRYMEIISSTYFPESDCCIPLHCDFRMRDQNSHHIAFSFSSCRHFEWLRWSPSVVMVNDLLEQNRPRIEYRLCKILQRGEIGPWTREHYILFSESIWVEKVRNYGIDGLIRLGETELVRKMALETGGGFFSYAIQKIDCSTITAKDLSKVIETDISDIFSNDAVRNSSQLVFAFIESGYRSKELTRCLVSGKGDALEYALDRGFQVDDRTLSLLISFARGKHAIQMLKKRFGIVRYIRCISDTDIRIDSKRVTFAECLYDELSPDDALKMLRMHPTAYTDNSHIRQLLNIACAANNKRANSGPKQSAAKRRKI